MYRQGTPLSQKSPADGVPAFGNKKPAVSSFKGTESVILTHSICISSAKDAGDGKGWMYTNY